MAKESDSPLSLSHPDEHKITSHTQVRKTFPPMIIARSVQDQSTGEDATLCGGAAFVWSSPRRIETIKEKHPFHSASRASGLMNSGCPSQECKLHHWPPTVLRGGPLQKSKSSEWLELKTKRRASVATNQSGSLHRVRDSCTLRQL